MDTRNAHSHLSPTHQAHLNSSNVCDVLLKANYYGLPILQTRCAVMLANELTPANCLPLYGLLHGLAFEPNLMRHCMRLIRYAPARNAFDHADWSLVPPAALRAILSADAINCDETALFRALLNWARRRCERRLSPTAGPDAEAVPVEELRSEVADLHGCIRWETMPVHEFDACVDMVSGFFEPAQVHEMRTRCEGSRKRRQWLTCQGECVH